MKLYIYVSDVFIYIYMYIFIYSMYIYIFMIYVYIYIYIYVCMYYIHGYPSLSDKLQVYLRGYNEFHDFVTGPYKSIHVFLMDDMLVMSSLLEVEPTG